MKNVSSLGVAAVMAICTGHAAAQSTVTVYGVADVGIEYQKLGAGSKGPATHNTLVATGTSAANRLGFRGTEDLGAGANAFFILEGGFNVDDGTGVPAAFSFNRRSVVGLSGRWGELSMGRDYAPAFWVLADTDLNRAGMYAGPGTVTQVSQLLNARYSNGVYYISPSLNGFRARLAWTAGDESSTAPKDAGRMHAISGHYASDKLTVGAFYQATRAVYPAKSTSSDKNTYTGVSATYNFGVASLNGGFYRYDPAGPNQKTASTVLSTPGGVTDGTWVTLMVPVGAHEVRFNLGRTTTQLDAPQDGKTMLYGVNYIHNLSKSTSLYAGIGKIDNNAAAAINLEAGQRTIAGNGLGSATLATTLGIRKNF
jgi:predicted porin